MRNMKYGSTGSVTTQTESREVIGSANKNYMGNTLTKLNRLIPSHLQIAPTIILTLSVPR